MGCVEYNKIHDFYLPRAFLRLYDGPRVTVEEMWRILDRGTTNGGLVGSTIKSKQGLQPKHFREKCSWQGGDFINEGNQACYQCLPCLSHLVAVMPCLEGMFKLVVGNAGAVHRPRHISHRGHGQTQRGYAAFEHVVSGHGGTAQDDKADDKAGQVQSPQCMDCACCMLDPTTVATSP